MHGKADIKPLVGAAPVRVAIITLDNHLKGAVGRADAVLSRDNIHLSLHAASEWGSDSAALEQATQAIAQSDIIIVTMMFLDDHVRTIMPALEARREDCDAMVCLMSAGDVVKLTRMGNYRMDAPAKGPLALLKKLRGSKKQGSSSGAGQMKMLRRLPKILKYIPGTAQDVRAYFLTLQYWLAGSDENVIAMVRALIDRYASGEREGRRGETAAPLPLEYPENGVYHPRARQPISDSLLMLPRDGAHNHGGKNGTVGLILLRSYLLGNDAGHYNGAIAAFEAAGLKVVPVFASGLDARPAIEKYFVHRGQVMVDAVVNLTGFSLVGGPAYNDAEAARGVLSDLDVPYVAAHALEFQPLEHWRSREQGLLPLEATMMVALPELDGGTAPSVYGGRCDAGGGTCTGCERHCATPVSEKLNPMRDCPERAEALAARVAKLIALRRSDRAARKLAIVLFNFPPNAGATGTAAFLSVFESLQATLERLAAEGYAVEVPENVDALRDAILKGNSERFGSDANVAHRVPADEHVRREKHLAEIEAAWGPAPGKAQSDGAHIQVLGAHFGNVFVGIQPGFGYEGDPMRLLFEGSFAPTHAFSAFYRYIREDFGAHSVLHFGTHGALEFMPGKQAGMTGACWPERLIGDLPNYYLYAANNPSEGLLAKRRSAATLISYMTPPLAQAGLYKGLSELKASVERWRASTDEAERAELAELIVEQCDALDIDCGEMESLSARLYEMERALIPHGLHVFGRNPQGAERESMLDAMVDASDVTGGDNDRAVLGAKLDSSDELGALIHALDGCYVQPAPGGDIVANPDVLPTGRNIHGFDPFLLPSRYACKQGEEQANRLIARHVESGQPFPESIAMVLWGTDNLKSEGVQIAQVLTLMGARPRRDSYGRLCGAELIPLEQLGRPRIDVVATLSGIFRDLLPLQTRMLAEAALLASQADEPLESNFVRKHSLAQMERHGCDIETAALRVFSNAEGAYGANVNQMIEGGVWADPDELANAFEVNKGFAYGVSGKPVQQRALLQSVLKDVDFTYQNLESVEIGINDVDQYVDGLGGVTRSVAKAKGAESPVYILDATRGSAKVRTLSEQIDFETRTRTLNPKWFEGLLQHGYEGVRAIEGHVTSTLGWSATTGQVAPWVYQKISETFVLDPEMRRRLSELNPKASARVAGRLLEACDRNLWEPDEATLAALREANDELEDRLEGVFVSE
ncbi:magnesium chelatase subunit H [Erythrobacter aurantius]|uniref:magnesium chelatase subunit H n=1 Tax=Erythrobacter aurantius TaxID=2909249 RepID=UPI002079D312|nr:magnesium chelatase subunit H [Erythrobacter aurantius]